MELDLIGLLCAELSKGQFLELRSCVHYIFGNVGAITLAESLKRKLNFAYFEYCVSYTSDDASYTEPLVVIKSMLLVSE